MRRPSLSLSWLGALALLLATPACQRGRATAPAGMGPRLVVETTVHHFGMALAGTILEHAFTMRNVGDQKLVLGALSTSCGCTTALPEEREVSPGKSTRIMVKFDSRGYEGETRNTVYVMSNDPRAPRTVLAITANVELPLSFEPRHFKLITDDPAHRTKRIWLTGRYASQAQLRVNHIEGDPAAGKIVAIRPIDETDDGGIHHGIEFKLKTARPIPGSAIVVLDTGLPAPAQLAIEFEWAESVKLR